MDRALKMLIGLASVAVIAAVGYHFTGEWRGYSRAKEKAQTAERHAEIENCNSIRRELDGWSEAGRPTSFDLDGTKARFRACLTELHGTMFEAMYADRMDLTR